MRGSDSYKQMSASSAPPGIGALFTVFTDILKRLSTFCSGFARNTQNGAISSKKIIHNFVTGVLGMN